MYYMMTYITDNINIKELYSRCSASHSSAAGNADSAAATRSANDEDCTDAEVADGDGQGVDLSSVAEDSRAVKLEQLLETNECP